MVYIKFMLIKRNFLAWKVEIKFTQIVDILSMKF